MGLNNARLSLHTQVVVVVEKEEGRPVYLVEWPSYCLVTFKEMENCQRFLQSITDATNCSSCVYFESECWPYKPKLYSRRVDLED